MKQRILVILTLLFGVGILPLRCWAASPRQVAQDSIVLSADTLLRLPKRSWRAAAETFGVNMAVWAFDHYLMNEDFADISCHTIKQNFKNGFGPYDWFRMRGVLNFSSTQPLLNQVNILAPIWGKEIWRGERQSLLMGIFQHFDYYDSERVSPEETLSRAPYRIAQVASFAINDWTISLGLSF